MREDKINYIEENIVIVNRYQYEGATLTTKFSFTEHAKSKASITIILEKATQIYILIGLGALRS